MASGRNFVQECFKSGFKNRCRDIEIIGDCMKKCIPDMRGIFEGHRVKIPLLRESGNDTESHL